MSLSDGPAGTVIGGLTRECDVEASAVVNSKYPLLMDTAAVIADPQGAAFALFTPYSK